VRLSEELLQYKAWQLQAQPPYQKMKPQFAFDGNSVCISDRPEMCFLKVKWNNQRSTEIKKLQCVLYISACISVSDNVY
jgi:hypothetical protein